MNIFFVADCGCMSRDECALTNRGGDEVLCVDNVLAERLLCCAPLVFRNA